MSICIDLQSVEHYFYPQDSKEKEEWMNILFKSFIMVGMIVLALSWSAKLSFAGHREDAIHHIERAINALDNGRMKQASKHTMNAARSTRRVSRRLSRKLKRIAKKMRRVHRRHHNDDYEEIMDDLENIKEDLEEDDDNGDEYD